MENPSPWHEQQIWAEKNIKEVWFHWRRNCEVLLQQDVSMIICDQREKTVESAGLINSYTILYVLSGERGETVVLTPYCSPSLVSGENISLRSNSGIILPHKQKLGHLQLSSWYLARTFALVHRKNVKQCDNLCGRISFIPSELPCILRLYLSYYGSGKWFFLSKSDSSSRW